MASAIAEEHAVDQRPVAALGEDDVQIAVAIEVADTDIRRCLRAPLELERAIEGRVGNDTRHVHYAEQNPDCQCRSSSAHVRSRAVRLDSMLLTSCLGLLHGVPTADLPVGDIGRETFSLNLD